MAQHTGNFLFLIYLGYFFPSFSGRGRPAARAEKADARDHSILVNFSLGITLLLFTYPQDSRPPEVTWWNLPHDFVIQVALIAGS